MKRSFAVAISIIASAALLSVALIFVIVQISQEDEAGLPPSTHVSERPLLIVTEPTQTPRPTHTQVASTHPPTNTPTATQSQIVPSIPPTNQPTTAGNSPTWTTVPTLTPQASLTPTPASPTVINIAASTCPPPEGWQPHTVGAGETLFAYQLGVGSAVSVDEIMRGNCLTTRFILEGQVLWLPEGAAENAPSSETAPTPLPAATFDPAAPPPPDGLTRPPNCPCQVAIQQGWRLEQVAELIDSLPVGFRGQDLRAITLSSLPPRPMFTGAPSGATLEGYMLPGAYVVTNEMGVLAFVKMVLNSLENSAGNLWADAEGRQLTPYGAVTLASIINKESRTPSQQALIASVFHNRLSQGGVLGATVTTQYVLGRAGNWWPNVAGQISTFNSPYNTNINKGLPPTAISSPTLDALRAAVYAEPTNYYFFTANCRGTGNVFAETYEQHLANVRCE